MRKINKKKILCLSKIKKNKSINVCTKTKHLQVLKEKYLIYFGFILIEIKIKNKNIKLNS